MENEKNSVWSFNQRRQERQRQRFIKETKTAVQGEELLRAHSFFFFLLRHCTVRLKLYNRRPEAINRKHNGAVTTASSVIVGVLGSILQN